MNKYQSIFLRLGKGIVYGLFSLISCYLFLLSLFTTCFMVYTNEHIYYVKDYALMICAGLLALCCLLAFFKKQKRKRENTQGKDFAEREIRKLKACVAAGTGILGAVMLCFILYAELPPVYDQSMVYHSAHALLKGDYSAWKMGEYFSMLPYQNGMVLMICPFATLFKEYAWLMLQIFNIPVLFLAYAGIGKIVALMWDKKTAYYTYLALLAVIPMWTQVTFVYGVIPGFCLSVWAVYFSVLFEKTGKWRNIIISGICLFSAIMWKSNTEIFLLALCIMLLVDGVRKKNWKSFAGCLILAGFAILEIKGVPWVLHLITGENTTNGIPMTAWLAMGLQESGIAPGWYNEFPMNLYRKVSSDPDVIRGEVLKSFRDSFLLFRQEKSYAVRFFARKTASMWADPAFQFFTNVNTRNLNAALSYPVKDFFYNGGITNTIMYLLLDVLQSIHYFGIVLYLIIKRKELKLENAHLLAAFLGGFLFHFIGEAKSHYVMPYYLITVPYVVQGYREIAVVLGKINWKEKQAWSAVRKWTGMRICGVLAALIVLISILNTTAVTNTLKLGGEESDYIWYCTHEIQWKDADYKKA